jgi:hypothetical protein
MSWILILFLIIFFILFENRKKNSTEAARKIYFNAGVDLKEDIGGKNFQSKMPMGKYCLSSTTSARP